MPIAVGIDAANLLRDRRGIGRYVRSLLHTWRGSFAGRIETTLLVPALFRGLVESRLARDLGVPSVHVARPSDASRLSLDLVWYPWNGMTWTPQTRSVVTVHDVWPFSSPAADLRKRTREQRHFIEGASRADRFIAVSRFTAMEASTYLHIDPERIDVVPHGVGLIAEPDILPARFEGIDRYVLFVGEVEPRKDVGTLLDAVSRLPGSLRRKTALVIAGRSRALRFPGPASLRIERTGEVSDRRLASLYAGAAAFVFPSRYEGFGLPVLEAMRYGAPVIASSAAAIPEAGGDAAMYFAPGDAGALARALERVLDDAEFAHSLAQAGRAHAAEFTPERCAQTTLEVFERVVRS